MTIHLKLQLAVLWAISAVATAYAQTASTPAVNSSTSATAPTSVTAPAAPVLPESNTQVTPALNDAPVAPSGKRTGGYVPVPKATESATEVTTAAAIGDLWHRIRIGFQMDDRSSEAITGWENRYAGQPDYLRRLAERGGKYLFHIVEEVEKRNLPTEIALLPVIESAFVATAQSHAKASGIWQFIPSTGKVFGLDQNYWVDNRRDIVEATRAALDYLQKLYGMFGSWELAFAAYNCGEGCVGRAIAANQKAGLPTDFWSLNLPNETKAYVPKLLAVKNIVSSPATYGIALTNIDNESYFARVAAPAMDLKLAAQFAEMSVADFLALNPAFNRGVAKSAHGHLLLPKDKVEPFQLNMAKHRSPLLNWRQATIRKGEPVAAFAKRNGVSLATLKANNSVHQDRRGRAVYAANLLIPTSSGSSAQALAALDSAPANASDGTAQSASTVARRHVVRRGENLSSIARKYSVSAANVQSWSGLPSSSIQVGQSVVVGHTTRIVQTARSVAASSAPVRVAQATKAKTAKYYSVRNGDTLSGIAGKFGLSLSQLCKMNGVRPNVKLALNKRLRVG